MPFIKKMLLTVLISTTLFFGCKDNSNVPVTGVALNATTATLNVGDNVELKATVLPDNASDKTVSWDSNNPAAAIVDNGLVIAQAPGTAVISVVTHDGNKTATCEVTVSAVSIPVSSIALNRTDVEMTCGDTLLLTASVQPYNATGKEVTWTTSNPDVAVVSDNGVVTAVYTGTAYIIATAGDKTARCAVAVKCTNLLSNIVIPKPVDEEYSGGILIIPQEITVGAALNSDARDLLVGTLQNDTKIKVNQGDNQNSFIRFVTDNQLAAEAYEIHIETDKIEVVASAPQGTLWAVQTLRQLLKYSFVSQPEKPNLLPIGVIKDQPAYAWREFHLDVARHFFDKPSIEKLIEWFSFYKVNKFHIHLSDDQGWRIQIDKYPLLTQNGVFYTKADMREIIAYASKYGVEIIPEIDMPGHTSAAISAYPYLSCTDGTGWGTEFSYPICPCNPDVIAFAKDIYGEIADLFPSQYVHIGADEADRTTWDASPLCQQFMKEQGMSSSLELQTYFVSEMQQFLESKGKKVIVWDDATEGDINNRITVEFWRSWMDYTLPSIKSRGFPIVFAESDDFYLSSGLSFDRWKNLYNFNIESRFSITKNDITGYQVCIWTESIASTAQLQQYVFPYLQAFCELAWGSDRLWDDFLLRMQWHYLFMDQEKINYKKY